MSLLDILQRKFGRLAVPHVTLGLIACQAVAYVAVLARTQPDALEPPGQPLELIPVRVLDGEVWRLATFLIVPPFDNIICLFFFWYLF